MWSAFQDRTTESASEAFLGKLLAGRFNVIRKETNVPVEACRKLSELFYLAIAERV
jgi:hypothetical protein